MNITIDGKELAMILAALRELAASIASGRIIEDSGEGAVLTDAGKYPMPSTDDVQDLADRLNEPDPSMPAGNLCTYTLAEIRNGTGWPKGQRFVAISGDASEGVKPVADVLNAIIARLNGEFDNPALAAFGALSGDRESDVIDMASRALTVWGKQE